MTEEKIICAVEHWDYILDYWKPNCWSSSWLLKEEGQLGYPYSLFLDEVKSFHSSEHKGNIITPYFKNVEYKKYSEIENTSKYLYLIPVQPISFFCNKHGFKLISHEILNDVRNDRCNIVILFENEGNLGVSGAWGHDIKILDAWCDEVNIPHKNVHLIHGNLLIDKLKEKNNLKINVIPISIFESWVYRESLKNYKTEYIGSSIFLNYNRQPRHQRLIFCCELIKNNLLEKNLVSFNTANNLTYDGGLNIIKNYDENLVETYKSFYEKENLRLFLDTQTEDNLANSLNIRHYDESFLSVVNETFVCEDMIFFSEKTWKPIFLGHPFILIGNPGSLKKLKEMGYKTFDRWIDESYDENIPLKERYNIIIKEIKKFSQMSNEELRIIRDELREICVHNKNHFLREYDRKFSNNNHPITHHLKNIWYNLNKKEKIIINVYKHITNGSNEHPHIGETKLLSHLDFLLFDIEKNNFAATSDIKMSDIIPWNIGGDYLSFMGAIDLISIVFPEIKNKLLLITMHTHVWDNQLEFITSTIQNLENKNINFKIITTLRLPEDFNKHIISYDFLFNRQKAYFTDYEKFDMTDRLWTLDSSKDMFKLDQILKKFKDLNYKKFLIPNRFLTTRESTVKERNYYRKILSTHINSDDCFYSDFSKNPPIILKPQEDRQVREDGGWLPISNDYYANSFISVYIETITYSTTAKTITEKTFDPLIKGHFILPFGYCGMISDLKAIYGFKFPEWIDYNYDTIYDTEDRFNAFIESFHTLRKMDIDTLIDNFNRDIDMLVHNRQIFFDRPYDSLYEKIKAHVG